MTKIICPLCNSENTKKFFSKTVSSDDPFYIKSIHEHPFQHFKCKSCYFVFLPKSTKLDLDEYYGKDWCKACEYEDQRLNLEKLFTQRLNDVKSYLNGRKILDVGCALGFSLKAYSDNNYDAYGMEVSENSIISARKFTKFDVIQQTIEEPTSWNDNFFDAVTMFDVMEHLSQPLLALQEVNRILKKDGILYISTLNFDGIGRKLNTLDWRLLSPPGHMSYFSKKTLLRALKLKGFSIIKIRCFGLATNNKRLQRMHSIMHRRFPKIEKLFELMNLGDYIDVIAKKR